MWFFKPRRTAAEELSPSADFMRLKARAEKYPFSVSVREFDEAIGERTRCATLQEAKEAASEIAARLSKTRRAWITSDRGRIMTDWATDGNFTWPDDWTPRKPVEAPPTLSDLKKQIEDLDKKVEKLLYAQMQSAGTLPK
jgi:hypothetical protein